MRVCPAWIEAFAKNRKRGSRARKITKNDKREFSNLEQIDTLLGPRPDWLPPGDDDVGAAIEAAGRPVLHQRELERLCSALAVIPADCSYGEWVDVGLSLHATEWGEAALAIWDRWSRRAPHRYPGFAALEHKWASFGREYNGPRRTVASIYHDASARGWLQVPPVASVSGPYVNGVAALPASLTTETASNPLIKLNEKHAVINNLGNKPVVLDFIESPIKGVGKIPSFVTFKSFEDRYRNQYVTVDVQKQRVVQGQPVTVTVEETKELGRTWLSWNQRRTYEGIGLAPEGNLPQGYYNLWNGFAVEPRPGCWDRMKWHIQHVIGNNDEKAINYAVKWAAWTVQHPGELAGSALVLRGDEGVGKGLFATTLQSFFGSHGLHIHSSKHMIGFNALLRNCVYLFADEAFWAGDKAGESTLKGLITDPTITIEQKGIDATPWPNQLHIVMAANAEWVIPARHDARRYGVLDVNNMRARNQIYFDALVYELDHGGREAMLHDLLHLDLDGWHPRRIPNTEALRDQKALSLDWRDQWWAELLQRGSLPFRIHYTHDDPALLRYASAKILLDYARDFVGNGVRNYNPAALGRYLGKKGKGCLRHHTEHGELWEFPELNQLRDKWEKHMGGWEWDFKLTEWQKKTNF